MKQQSLVSYGMLGAAVVALTIGLASPRERIIEKNIIIEASPEKVFQKVSDLSTWSSWSPWKELDPNMRFIPAEVYAGKGARGNWVSSRAGDGRILISDVSENRSVGTEIYLGEKGYAQGSWEFEPTVEGHTLTTWTLRARFPLFYDARPLLAGLMSSGSGLGHGLQLLKAEVETAPPKQQQTTMEVQQVEIPETTFIGTRKEIGMAEMQGHYAQNLPAIMGALQKEGIQPTGMPCGLYFSWDPENNRTDLATVIPVPVGTASLGGFEVFTIPAGKALLVDFYGNYERLEEPHSAIHEYMDEHGLTFSWPLYEQYVTDPGTESNPDRWLTRVVYPLAR